MNDFDIVIDPHGDTIKSLNSQQFTRLAVRFYGEAVEETENPAWEMSAWAQAGVCASLALLSEIHDLRLLLEEQKKDIAP